MDKRGALVHSLIGAGSSFECTWLRSRFQDLSKSAMQSLKDMGAMNKSDTSVVIIADFPEHLYVLASTATDEDKVRFVVQVLDEVADLFKQDHTSAAWEKVTLEHFLQAVTQQANGLRRCTQHHKRQSRKLRMYFKRLALDLQEMEHSAKAWEMVRAAIIRHLFTAQQTVKPLMS